MIIITGAAGFIGSCLLSHLNNKGIDDIIIVDDFSSETFKKKIKNLENKKFKKKIEREQLFHFLNKNKALKIDFVFHIGARTDTTEFNEKIFQKLNIDYSKKIWTYCSNNEIPLLYASSAATYGAGKNGYSDEHNLIPKLKPLNPYAYSKQKFDLWVLKQDKTPPFWCGLKFFNVYGPNEYHKGRMASVIFHSYNQIKKTGKVRLFQSHNPQYKDGEQKRDFIYVKDVVSICDFFRETKVKSGIYNVGTGKARTFNTLAKLVFRALNKKENIEYIPTPEDIRDKYQYFTEAKIDKLYKAGYKKNFYSLEQGINEYVTQYLEKNKYE